MRGRYPWLRQLATRTASPPLRLRDWLVGDAEKSPHTLAGQRSEELCIACAEYDALAPLPMVEELRTLFDRAGTAGEIEIYPGVHHGFAFPQRWCYDQPAAERHWEAADRALPTAPRLAAEQAFLSHYGRTPPWI